MFSSTIHPAPGVAVCSPNQLTSRGSSRPFKVFVPKGSLTVLFVIVVLFVGALATLLAFTIITLDFKDDTHNGTNNTDEAHYDGFSMWYWVYFMALWIWGLLAVPMLFLMPCSVQRVEETFVVGGCLLDGMGPVSYTHLTLPTIYSV